MDESIDIDVTRTTKITIKREDVERIVRMIKAALPDIFEEVMKRKIAEQKQVATMLGLPLHDGKQEVAKLDTEDLPLGLSWNIPTASEKETPKKNKRLRRKHLRKLVVNGVERIFNNMRQVIIEYDLKKYEWEIYQFSNNYYYEKTVELEAKKLRHLLAVKGLVISKYCAYDYNGEWKTVEFPVPDETEAETAHASSQKGV
jgi:hypothetical protein